MRRRIAAIRGWVAVVRRVPAAARATIAAVPRAIRAIRRGARDLGRAPTAVLCVAALTVTVMYCSNDNYDAHPEAVRGHGGYHPILARGDGHMHFLITRSLVFDGDFNWDNDLARFGDPWNQPKTVTGRKNLMQEIGPSLIWAPVLALAHGAATVANLFGADIPTHGYTMFHQRILFATSVAFGILAMVLGVGLARRLVGGRWGPVYAGVAILLGTSLTYYATYMPSYAHAMDAAASAGFFALWARHLGELRWKRFVWLGVLLGIAALIRTGNFAFGIVVAVELAVLAYKKLRDDGDIPIGGRLGAAGLILVRGMVVIAIAIALHAPQFYVWKQMYGAWITTPQGPGWMRWGHPMWLELLFSAKNGWFSTHPLAYLGVLGLGLGAALGPRIGEHVRIVSVGFLLAIASQVYLNSASYDWFGGAAFGQRRMCSSTLPVIVGVAIVLRGLELLVRARVAVWVRHVIAAIALGWFVVWNMVWVSHLRHGKGAGREPGPMCCNDMPAPLAWIAKPIYDAVGNPFAFPGNAVFAIRHGVDLQRWDRAVGSYPLVPPHLGYNDGSYRREVASWFPGDAYLLAGWAGPQTAGKQRWRWTTASDATVLLPVMLPEPHQITVPVAANVGPGQTAELVIRVDDVEVARTTVGPTWTPITFVTPGTSVGEREVTFATTPAPYRIEGGVPPAPTKPAGAAVGVAVGQFRIGLPPLSPAPVTPAPR